MNFVQFSYLQITFSIQTATNNWERNNLHFMRLIIEILHELRYGYILKPKIVFHFTTIFTLKAIMVKPRKCGYTLNSNIFNENEDVSNINNINRYNFTISIRKEFNLLN